MVGTMSSCPVDPFKPSAVHTDPHGGLWFRRRPVAALAALAATNDHGDESDGKMAPMPRDSARLSLPCMHAALAASLLLPMSGAAQAPTPHHRGTASSFSVTLTIRPAFRILETRPVPGGHEYRIWTNLKNARLNGRDYRFERVGETTLVVPGGPIESPLKPAS
jgi:hypothetical protein